MNPTEIPEYKKRNKIYLVIDTDFPMRRKRENYSKATTESEVWLTALAEETGGLVFIPKSEQEMISGAEEIAREIDCQYVVTYSPKRPLAEATVEEYRRIKIAAVVGGIQLRSRRGYVARAPKQQVTKQSCPSCGAEGHDPDALCCKYCGAKL